MRWTARCSPAPRRINRHAPTIATGPWRACVLGSGLYVTFDHGAPNRTIELPGGLLIHCHGNSTDVPGSADSAYALGDGYYAETEDDGTVNVYDHVGDSLVVGGSGVSVGLPTAAATSIARASPMGTSRASMLAGI